MPPSLFFKVTHGVKVDPSACRSPSVLQYFKTAIPSKVPRNDPKQSRFDDAIAKMVAVDGLPISVTSGLGFCYLIQVIDPTLTVKSRDTIRRRIFKDAATYRNNIKEMNIASMPPKRLHGITDIWTTKSQQSVIGVRLQFITNDFRLQNKTVAFEEFPDDHTGVNIRKKIAEIFQKFEIQSQQFGVIVSDNARNMINAFNSNILFDEKWEQVPGIAQNSETTDSEYEDDDDGDEEEIIEINSTEILTIGTTRWNSLFTALERIVDDEVFPHLADLLLEYNTQNSASSSRNRSNKQKNARRRCLKIPTEIDRNKIKELLKILGPFKDITDIFQSNEITSSLVIPSLLDLQSKLLRISCVYYHSFRDSLLKNLEAENRFKKVVTAETFVVPNMLDPRYKSLMFGPQSSETYFQTPSKEEARDTVDEIVNKMQMENLDSSHIHNTSNSDCNEAFDFLIQEDEEHQKSELQLYLEEPVLDIILKRKATTIDVLNYWRTNQSRFPILEMAKIYLAIPASSGDIERLFSIAGFLKRQHRNRLDIEFIEDLLISRECALPVLKKNQVRMILII
ncbi:unnamed protein product [Allacma fusca]|uniref:HAT C-terminal dimerisation domain-containing protein n=1 Tax=Allacma fusca TaxID=39272 RepID=A0A8J2KE62_9HEXA|nr:unnamed protein product [Allacma fusca]